MPVDFQAIKAELGKIPWWGYGLAGGVVIAGYMVIKRGQASKSSTSGITANNAASANLPPGLNAADIAGLPFDSTDFSPAFATGDPTQFSGTPPYQGLDADGDSDTAAGTPGAPGSAVGNPQQQQQQQQQQPAQQQQQQPTYSGPSIRPRAMDTSGIYGGDYGYDANHPQGVPLWTAPGGQQMGYAPFGEQVNVSGPSNGFYKLASGGYVATRDVVTGPTGGGHAEWPAWDGEMPSRLTTHYGVGWGHLDTYHAGDSDLLDALDGAAIQGSD